MFRMTILVSVLAFAWSLGFAQQTVTTPGGTVNAVPKFSAAATIVDSAISETGGKVGIGTKAPSSKLTVTGVIQSTSGGIKFPDNTVQKTAGVGIRNPGGVTNTAAGVGALQNNHGTDNTAIGNAALQTNTTGSQNTSNGYWALLQNTSGGGNTAIGSFAMQQNTTGNYNTALGSTTLVSNQSGSYNTAIGGALYSNTAGSGNVGIGAGTMQQNTIGGGNTAIGTSALGSNVDGSNNVALGPAALESLTSGSENVAIGDSALGQILTGDANIAVGLSSGEQVINGTSNIFVGHLGLANDSHIIRIGTSQAESRTVTYHTAAYIAGINNATVSGSAVLIDPVTGQLGVASSSIRYKQDIQDIGKSSDALMKLRPVSFRYKQLRSDGAQRLQYGLIGEEVVGVYPELVTHGADGQIESVQYHELPVLLLSELQKEHETIQKQRVEISAQKEELESLKERITLLEQLVNRTR